MEQSENSYVIYTCTRKQAIDDGDLVDVDLEAMLNQGNKAKL